MDISRSFGFSKGVLKPHTDYSLLYAKVAYNGRAYCRAPYVRSKAPSGIQTEFKIHFLNPSPGEKSPYFNEGREGGQDQRGCLKAVSSLDVNEVDRGMHVVRVVLLLIVSEQGAIVSIGERRKNRD